MLSFPFPSAAAKKASVAHGEASGNKEDGEEQKKEGLNGEVEEESNGKVKEAEGATFGSKLRACRRTGGGGGSGAGMHMAFEENLIKNVPRILLQGH